ncbi:MAG: hypothetical protein EBS19_12840, partial [Spirochaetia bacterium]|nr:hypothetical protein [Spirochaetia bacterium]
MTNSFSKLRYLFTKISVKYNSMSLVNRVLFWYVLMAIPFLYYHEKHLPFPIILLLVSLAILVSIVIVFCSFYLLGFIFKWDFFWVVEGLYLGISIFILYFLE